MVLLPTQLGKSEMVVKFWLLNLSITTVTKHWRMSTSLRLINATSQNIDCFIFTTIHTRKYGSVTLKEKTFL